MPLIGAGRNISPRIQAIIDAWLLANGYAAGGGAFVENFDGSLLLPAGFTTSGDANWFIQGTTFLSPGNAAESGDIGDSQSTSLFLVKTDLTTENSLSFKFKTDTENGFDQFRLYLNGNFITQWSGSQPWTPYIINCENGLNTFEWQYIKDGSVSGGSDTVWIDDVVIV